MVAAGVRIGCINAEDVFDSSPGELGQRYLPGLADLLGPRVHLVG